MTAFQLAHQCGWLVMQGRHQRAVVVGDRRRDQYAALGKVAHQVQVERQFLEAQLFEDGQYVFAGAGGNEEITVLNTGSNALDAERLSDRKLGAPGA